VCHPALVSRLGWPHLCNVASCA